MEKPAERVGWLVGWLVGYFYYNSRRHVCCCGGAISTFIFWPIDSKFDIVLRFSHPADIAPNLNWTKKRIPFFIISLFLISIASSNILYLWPLEMVRWFYQNYFIYFYYVLVIFSNLAMTFDAIITNARNFTTALLRMRWICLRRWMNHTYTLITKLPTVNPSPEAVYVIILCEVNAEIVVLEMGTHEAKIVTIFETILWLDFNFFPDLILLIRMSLVERESGRLIRCFLVVIVVSTLCPDVDETCLWLWVLQFN